MVACVWRALVTLHENSIIHRDLKPSNLLLMTAGDPNTVCVCDVASSFLIEEQPETFEIAPRTGPVSFGDSSPMPTEVSTGSYITRRDSSVTQSPSTPSLLAAGTPLFMSPQAIAGHSPSTSDDIWAVGCVAFEIMHGCSPFKAAESLVDLANRVVGGTIEDLEDSVSDAARLFVSKLMDMNELKRPSAEEALLDPWMVEMLATFVPEGFDVGNMLDLSAGEEPISTRDRPTHPAVAKSFSFAVPGDPRLQMSGAFVYFDDERTVKDSREPCGIPRRTPSD